MEDTNWNKICIQVSYSELLDMVTGMISTAEKLISIRAPKILVSQTIRRAKKFNNILRAAGYDHWTQGKFIELKEKAQL